MKKVLIAGMSILVWTGPVFSASAQPNPEGPALSCGNFQHRPDGSWVSVEPVNVRYPNGNVTIAAQVNFPAKGSYMGMPFAQLLDEQCGFPVPTG